MGEEPVDTGAAEPVAKRARQVAGMGTSTASRADSKDVATSRPSSAPLAITFRHAASMAGRAERPGACAPAVIAGRSAL